MILLTTFGAVLLVGGIAQWLQVSAAIGAFLVGIAVSGPIAKRAYRLVAPLRDLFAATFFLFFGLEIDPATLPGAAAVALAAGILTTATKIASGYWAASRAGVDHRGRLRAGAALVARGEFSIVIAGLGIAVQPEIGPVSAAYVLFLAVAGPVIARLVRWARVVPAIIVMPLAISAPHAADTRLFLSFSIGLQCLRVLVGVSRTSLCCCSLVALVIIL